MRIAIVTPYIKGFGGVEIFNAFLGKILTSNSYDVTMIGVELLKKNLWNKWQLKKKGLEYVIGDLFNKMNKSHKFDIVICNGEFGIKVDFSRTINVFHGSYLGYFNAIREFITEEQYFSGMKLAGIQVDSARGKLVVTVSNYNKDVLTEQGIMVDAVIRNAVDTKIFKHKPVEVEDRCLFVSRFDYYGKGIDVLEKLADKGIRFTCVMDKELVYPNVISETPVRNDELPKFYNKASCFVFPSRFEGGELVSLEAMACGCPVIVRPVGYGFDIKREIPEFVVESEDIEEYIDKIRLVSRNRDYYAKKALEYVSNYHSVEKFEENWISLIRKYF